MIEKSIVHKLERLLERTPAVVLTGPRQIGKTTLARQIARKRGAVYLTWRTRATWQESRL